MLCKSVIFFTLLWARCTAHYRYTNRTTVTGIAEYRSALTLDWLGAEDVKQKELALAFKTESLPPEELVASECVSYDKPSTGKIARLLLELLKNLEGDDGVLITDLVQALIRSKLLVETSMLEAEPDLDALVKTPAVMMGEPHTTFPRVMAMVWMSATDPTATKKHGWCTLNKITKYLSLSRPAHVAAHLRALDPVVARARFILEEFIQHVTPNIYERRTVPETQTKAIHRGRLKMKSRSLPTPESLQSPLPGRRTSPRPEPMLPVAVENTPELYNEVLNYAAILRSTVLMVIGMLLV